MSSTGVPARSGARGVAAAALALLLFCALLTGCGEEATKPGQLRVGVNPFVGYAPLYVADAEDLCKRRGLDLELVVNTDPSFLDAELRTHAIDAAAFTNVTLVRNVAAGSKLVAFQTIDYSHGADAVVAATPDVSVRELAQRDLRLGADVGDTAYFLLMAVAARRGLGPDDFNVVQMTTDAAGSAFLAGKVDAAGLFEPFLSKARERPHTSVPVTTRDNPGVIADVFVAPEDVATSRAPDLARLSRCWFDALQFMRTHADEAEADVAKALSIPPAELQRESEAVVWPSAKAGYGYLLGGRFSKTITFADSLYREVGLIPDGAPELDGPLVTRKVADLVHR